MFHKQNFSKYDFDFVYIKMIESNEEIRGEDNQK